ncbi:MAG: outer membrane beta-barrel protein [Bacteroidetes bacterium]|nr:outer membrane beta-barrel protein [Bacteroidota bacterium]
MFLVLITHFTLSTNAQFVRGIGIMGGVTFAKHKFEFKNPDAIEKKKFVFGFNGELFGEFGRGEYIRWQSEFQYNQKGSKDKTDSTTYKNKLAYVCWNNYLKIRYELFGGIPYLLIGPRIEYKLSEAMQSPTVVSSFKNFQFSPSFGAGWEFVTYSNIKPIVEVHYNPDMYLNAYKTTPLDIKNRAWEIRVGLKYLLGNASEDCPPVYR